MANVDVRNIEGKQGSHEIDQETMPDGSYKYIFFGADEMIIFSPIMREAEHKDLISRPFDPSMDDAGRLSLNWALTPDEVSDRVSYFEGFAQYSRDDVKAYRHQLETNFKQTLLDIDAGYGSSTLGYYTPNLTNRTHFKQTLGNLFPNAKITEGKK